jgi:septum site-determining protein MinC
MTVASQGDAPAPEGPQQSKEPRKQKEQAELQAFKLRGGSFTLLVLQLIDLKNPNFYQWLLDKIAQAPNFYRHAPVVLDLQGLADSGPFNFAELGRRLRQHKLVPVGVQNGTEEQNQGAVNAGMSIFPMWRASQPLEQPAVRAASTPPADTTPAEVKPAEVKPAEVKPAEVKPAEVKSAEVKSAEAEPATPSGQAGDGAKLVTQPIRSGRQVYARHGDLVVLSTVSAGAELLADGHIHVYGALRGRALAGVSGDTSARIFCRSLQAELVSIAGHWLVREDMDDHLIGRTVQIYLKGELLVIEPMS